MFFVHARRRPTRRPTLTFDHLQQRITPSDLVGTATTGTITTDMWTDVSVMTITDTTTTSDTTSQDLSTGTMTLPTTSC